MKSGRKVAVVLVTAPDLKTSRKLARLALDKHLVACANLIPKIESHYWWQGKRETAAEVLIIFKAVRSRLAELKTLIRKEHPYDTPEFVVLGVSGVSRKYLDWWLKSAK